MIHDPNFTFLLYLFGEHKSIKLKINDLPSTTASGGLEFQTLNCVQMDLQFYSWKSWF